MSYSHYFALSKQLAKLGHEPDRAEMCAMVSQGRTDSLREITRDEYEDLIRHMSALVQKLQGTSIKPPGDKQRKKILSICYEIGWTTASGKIDWRRLNGWMNKYGYLHKPLDSYKPKELPRLVSQFERLQKHTYEKDHTETQS